MKFLIDENLPPRLAVWLRVRGHEAIHVRDASLVNVPDGTIAAWALTEERVVVTQDADFDEAPAPLRVLRLGLGNASVAALLTWLEPKLDGAIARLDGGEHRVRLV